MYRVIVFVLISLPLTAFANTEWKLLRYECEHIAPAVANFTCKLDNGMKLHMLKPKAELNQEQRKRADYEFDKIVLEYREIGGRGFDVTAEWWPDNAKRVCGFFHESTNYNCTDCLIQADGSCKEINK